MLSSNNTLLVPSFFIGADGALSGLGALAPDLVAEGFEAVQSGDLVGARRANERLFHLTRAIYRYPHSYWHVRIKEALVMTGRLSRAVVRPPLAGLPSAERPELEAALRAAGLLKG